MTVQAEAAALAELLLLIETLPPTEAQQQARTLALELLERHEHQTRGLCRPPTPAERERARALIAAEWAQLVATNPRLSRTGAVPRIAKATGLSRRQVRAAFAETRVGCTVDTPAVCSTSDQQPTRGTAEHA